MFQLKEVCGGCPEAYDVYYEGERVGYMRLRHGYFYAEYRGVTVFDGHPSGDGIFFYEERESWLNRACAAINREMFTEPQPLLYEMI